MSGGSQVRIASHHYRDVRPPTSENCLPRALVVPSVDDDSIVAALPNELAELWRIEAREACNRWFTRHVLKKPVGITIEQGDVPLEPNSETGLSLLHSRRLVAVQHFQVEAGLSGQ